MLQQDKNLDTLLQAGRQRLYPRITDPNWLVLRRRRIVFRAWLHRLPLQRSRVLDVGGRIQPYRELIAAPCKYWAIDLRPTRLVSAVANAAGLPFADNSFDLVLCTQMIEYAPQVQDVVWEIHRVLRPNGFLLLSTPSIAPCDSEQDRWRFLPPALSQLLSGFSETEIVPECGSAAGMLRTVAVFFCISARYEALRVVLSFLLVPFLNVLGAAGLLVREQRWFFYSKLQRACEEVSSLRMAEICREGNGVQAVALHIRGRMKTLGISIARIRA